MVKIMENPIKMDDLGVFRFSHYSWKHPYDHHEMFSDSEGGVPCYANMLTTLFEGNFPGI